LGAALERARRLAEAGVSADGVWRSSSRPPREPTLWTPAVQRRSGYIFKYTMPTSVHIPKPLLTLVDRRARALKISRNRLIAQALEREVTEGSDWSPDFFERLESPEPGVRDLADEMFRGIERHRRSKKPPRL
jgi:hypothetical protein